MDSPSLSSIVRLVVISILTTSSWAETFYNRQPFYQNRNYNNPFNGYQNGGDFSQNPFPYPQRFQQNGFRPFPNNQFNTFGQQPFLADIYKQLFQQHRNPFLNNGNTFGLGQENISQGFLPQGQGFPTQGQNLQGQGFPTQGQNLQGQGFPTQGQNLQGQGFGQYNHPAEGQGAGSGQLNPPVQGQGQGQSQGQGQPPNNYNGANNPNSNRPGQENVYTHGELPTSAIEGQGSSRPYDQQGQNPSLTDEEKRTTAQSPTTGQRPSVLPVVTDSDPASKSPALDPSNLNNGQQGQSPSPSDQGKRTTAQSPTTGQRPSVLPVATDSDSPIQSPDIGASNSGKKGHHDKANSKPVKGQNPGSRDQEQRTTAQSPTTGQRPSVLPVTDSDSPAQSINQGSSTSAKGKPHAAQDQKHSTGSVKTPVPVKEEEVDFDALLVEIDGDQSEANKKSKATSDPKVNNLEADSTQSKTKKPNDYDYEDTFDEPSKKPSKKTQEKGGKNPETLPKLDVRGNFSKSEKQNPKSKTEVPVPTWDFIEEEIIS